MVEFEQLFFQVPAVHLVGDIMFFPNEFLLRRIPHLNKIVDKKQRQAVESSKEQYLTNCNQNLVRWEKIILCFLITPFQIRFGTSLQLIGGELLLTQRSNEGHAQGDQF